MIDPIADMLTRIRNAEHGPAPSSSDAYVQNTSSDC